MGDLHPAQLHKLMRTWLLAEDPYGLNQRQEPTMGSAWQPPQPRGDNPSVPTPTRPRNPAARAAGESAVDKALNPVPPVYNEGERAAAYPDRAQAWGEQAVEKALTAPNVQSEAFQGARNPRAQAWGEEAVGEATARPGPLPMNAPGWASPEEAQAWAEAVGPAAVGRALQDKARGKMARGSGMVAPQITAPSPMTESTQPTGYAPSSKRASYWGPKAVESELDKEPE